MTLKMAEPDEEHPVLISVKERARLLNAQPPDQVVGSMKSSRIELSVEQNSPSAPEERPLTRPNLKQFGARSEELFLATKSGVVDLAEKGKTGFLGATDSIKELVARPKSSNGAITSTSKEAGVIDLTIREGVVEPLSTEDGSEARSRGIVFKPMSEWKLDFDRRQVRSSEL